MEKVGEKRAGERRRHGRSSHGRSGHDERRLVDGKDGVIKMPT